MTNFNLTKFNGFVHDWHTTHDLSNVDWTFPEVASEIETVIKGCLSEQYRLEVAPYVAMIDIDEKIIGFNFELYSAECGYIEYRMTFKLFSDNIGKPNITYIIDIRFPSTKFNNSIIQLDKVGSILRSGVK